MSRALDRLQGTMRLLSVGLTDEDVRKLSEAVSELVDERVAAGLEGALEQLGGQLTGILQPFQDQIALLNKRAGEVLARIDELESRVAPTRH